MLSLLLLLFEPTTFQIWSIFLTSIESLLTLFAVTFTFSCQTIVVESMFNSHQVNLSSENPPFIYISSASSSLIISLIIRYIMFLFASKFSNTLHFDEYNIMKFCERFEKQYDGFKSLRKNNESNILVIVLGSLQNLWKSFLHMLIEAGKFLKSKCEKNTKIRTSSRWSTLVFFWKNSKIQSKRIIKCVFTLDSLKVSRSN